MICKAIRKLRVALFLVIGLSLVPWSAAHASPLSDGVDWWAKLWLQIEAIWNPQPEHSAVEEKQGNTGGGTQTPPSGDSENNAGAGSDPDG